MTFDEDGLPNEDLVVSVCNGLVVYLEQHGFVHLVHHTLQEYFEREAANIFLHAQKEMVQTCLTYLSFNDFTSGPCLQDSEFTSRIRRWPLLPYASLIWGEFVRGVTEEITKELILSFLNRKANMESSVQILCVGLRNFRGYSQLFPQDTPPLWLAASHGLTSIVRHLLSQGTDVSAKTTWGDTALHRAVGCSQDDVVGLLLDHGADLSAVDHRGNTPLHLATRCWSDLFFSLCRDGRHFSYEETWEQTYTTKRLLLAKGASVNATNHGGETALHISVNFGHRTLTKLLLENGANITLTDRYGKTSLSIAAVSGPEELTQILLRYNLPNQIQSGTLDQALRIATLERRHTSFRLLLKNLGSPISTDMEGRRLVHNASFGGNLECVLDLVEHGFDLFQIDRQGRTCLRHAASAGSTGVIDFLLSKGLDRGQRDIGGWTPLHWAVKSGRLASILKLTGACLNSKFPDFER